MLTKRERMTGTFQIISDAIQVWTDGRTKQVARVLGLLDCDRPGLDKTLDFVLGEEDALRFKEIFGHECLGRYVEVAIRIFLRQGFGGRVRCGGRILRIF